MQMGVRRALGPKEQAGLVSVSYFLFFQHFSAYVSGEAAHVSTYIYFYSIKDTIFFLFFFLAIEM